MVKFATLYSGSSGNSTAIWDDSAVLLIDMGSSCKKTIFALGELGLPASSLSALLITHEHSDHIGGIQVFCKHYPTPIYCTQETASYLDSRCLTLPNQEFHVFFHGDKFSIGNFTVTPFRTSHDSMTCSGFRIDNGLAHIGVATDLGQMDDDIIEYLAGCQLVALESNYDEKMLWEGRYPADLKARIAGPHGHLSNEACAETAVRLVNYGTEHLVLMHLSEENNTPAKAETKIISTLEDNELTEECCEIVSAPRYAISKIWRISEC